MLKIVQRGAQLPSSFICDPSAEFQPGMVAELTIMGGQIVATVSNGTAPLGIIDDIKSRAFTNVSWNEVVFVPAVGVPGPNNTVVTPIDIKAELKKSNILASSFTSTVDVALNPVNGVITFVAGTPLNADIIGAGEPTGIRTVVNYTYQVANIPGVTVLTWGGKIKATWDWWSCCVDESYTILPSEAQLKGFNLLFPYTQLLSDLTLVTKN